MASQTPATSSLSTTATASAASGNYPIKGIKRMGYMDYKGKRTLVGVAEWEDTLVIIKDTKRLKANATVADDSKPPGLLTEDFNLNEAFDEEDVTRYVRGYTCHFCGTRLSTRSSGIRHEKKCNAEGAPSHICAVPPCTANCIGSSVWTRPPDGRSLASRQSDQHKD